MRVDFDVQGNNAVAIYKALGAPPINQAAAPGAKDKLTAGLLALFLGGFGVHKFYLGYTGPALVFLLTNTVGWIVTWMLFGLPNIALGVIAFIEGIIYLTRSEAEFEQLYVVGRRPWF
jgi:TM2 domain-containing membrane protein YozV